MCRRIRPEIVLPLIVRPSVECCHFEGLGEIHQGLRSGDSPRCLMAAATDFATSIFRNALFKDTGAGLQQRCQTCCAALIKYRNLIDDSDSIFYAKYAVGGHMILASDDRHFVLTAE
jgi:hypothetical protein